LKLSGLGFARAKDHRYCDTCDTRSQRFRQIIDMNANGARCRFQLEGLVDVELGDGKG
jgi:hypothetical protein